MENTVVQGDLISIIEEDPCVIYTIRVGRGTLIGSNKVDQLTQEENQKMNNIHLGVISMGQGITAYQELKEA